MSVVNQMLQDIDARREAAGIEALGANADIRSVRPPPRRRIRSSRRGPWLFAALAAFGIALWLTWGDWQFRNATPVTPLPTGKVVTSNPPPPAPAAAPVAAPVVLEVPPVPIDTTVGKPVEPAAITGVATIAAGPTAVPRVDKALTIPASEAPIPIRRASSPPSAETLKLSMKLSALVADAPPVPATAMPASPPTAPGVTTITNIPVRQVAADETVAAARALWNDGARPAALTTLRDALAAAETAKTPRAITVLARELARLEVADNRAQVALDLMRRLESLFADDPDAWALRGNAEQRLALHADAAESYLTALRLRPGEGKWMIGAAISLAANGRMEDARTWVERARERGAVTPTIGAYLQQLGVTAR
jgi:tetratricopeptide (TPR) repeat protein